jgi:LytR cell envelope-related transcriptional attenuator
MTFARVRSLAIVGVLVVSALVLVTLAVTRDHQTHDVVARGCPQGAVVANLKLPEPQNVKINVYNGTKLANLANEIANEFKSRKFTVLARANDPLGKRIEGVAVLRYGPKAVGAAWVVRAYFLNEADLEFDIKRTDDVVDVVLGPQFKQLATVTEVHQSLAQAGPAWLPKGTCDANAR